MEEINDVGQLKGRHSIADKITITATNAELGTNHSFGSRQSELVKGKCLTGGEGL